MNLPTVTVHDMNHLQKNGGRRELEAEIREVASALRRRKERALSSQDRIELSDSDDDEVHIVHDSTTSLMNHSSGKKQAVHKGHEEYDDDDSSDDEKIRRLHFQRKSDTSNATRNKTRSSSSSTRLAANMDPTVVAELKAHMTEDEFRKVMEAQMNPDFLATGRSSLRFNRPTPSKKGQRQETMEDYVSRNQPYNARGYESPEFMLTDEEDVGFDATKRSDRRSTMKRILASSSSSVDFIDDRTIEEDENSDDASWHDADEKRKSPSSRKPKRKRKRKGTEQSPKDAQSVSSSKKGRRSKSPSNPQPQPSPMVTPLPPPRTNGRSVAPSNAVLPSSRFNQAQLDAIDIDDSDAEVSLPLPNDTVISQIRQHMQQKRVSSRRSSGTSAYADSNTRLPAIDEAHVSDISQESADDDDGDDDDDEELTQPQQMVEAQFELVRKESHERYQRRKEQELAAAAAAAAAADAVAATAATVAQQSTSANASATAAPQQRSRGNSVAEAGYWHEEDTETPARGTSNERSRRSHSNADESMVSALSAAAGASNADAIDLT